MLATPVSNEELISYDRMVLQRAHKHFVARLAYRSQWGAIYGQGSPIGNTSLTIEDLLQQGRLFVLHQIRYYKCFGDRDRYGAGLSTLMQSYLDRKFISLAERHGRRKRGYGIVTEQIPICDASCELLAGDMADPETIMMVSEAIAAGGYLDG